MISYGTEDRRSDRVIPPVQTVYDCIVFRSTDIKELEVVANDSTSDPRDNSRDPKAHEEGFVEEKKNENQKEDQENKAE